MTKPPIAYHPIGFFRCQQSSPVESPRQAILSEHGGEVQFNKDLDPNCWRDLLGFSHVWLIYDFHLNSSWTPTVRPPRGHHKRGVLATRSPYRPNGIGISCVQIDRIEGHSLWVKGHDLLDGTPILDVKPYITYADSLSHASLGWLDKIDEFSVDFSSQVQEPIHFLSHNLGVNLFEILTQQLSSEPINPKIKRVKKLSETLYMYSYKTWRFRFLVDDHSIRVQSVSSGYTMSELSSAQDQYSDKDLHRRFVKLFKSHINY
jgi:tRNA (adenine37-N6)-methyltransferase